MRKADRTEKKKQNRKSRKIYAVAITVMLASATFIGTYPATANVSDNLAGSDISILGKLNDVVSGNFGTATTNAKLNQMKADVDSVRSSVSEMTKPYVGNLTLWVDSTTFPMDLPMPFCCRWYFGNMAPALTKSSTDLPLQQDLQTKIRRTMKQQSFLSGQLKR